MPVALAYPGVYIEEIPSGVHTLTGVSTSVASFIGYTARGSVNRPVQIFNFADFERAFGGLDRDSPLSYSVKLFFQNGGTQAWVVRVAHNAASASVSLLDRTGVTRLTVTAMGSGTWGNNLQVDIDDQTSNPASLFNMSVSRYVMEGTRLVPDAKETFRNLSLNPSDANYVLNSVNAVSQLVQVALAAPLPAPLPAGGLSTSGAISTSDLVALGPNSNRLAVFVDGVGPVEFTIATPVASTAALAADIAGSINTLMGGGTVVDSSTTTTVTLTSGSTAARSAVHFGNASMNNAAALLHLGTVNGGIEVDGAAPYRPVATGTVGAALAIPSSATGSILVNVLRGASATILRGVVLPLWGGLSPIPTAPVSAEEAVARLRSAITTAALSDAAFVEASASLVGGELQVMPGPGDPNISFNILDNGADTTATTLGLTAASGAVRNVGHYALGAGLTALSQAAGTTGNNGSAPIATELSGSPALKTGIYALEDVDLFNLLVMPDATAGAGLQAVLTEAIAYCQQRRAFMIIDAPATMTNFAQVRTWMSGPAAPLRSRNSAIYFPRLRMPDPLLNNSVQSFPVAGAIAGLYARTDAERGVWKAPAGTAATISGATGLSYPLTDAENGVLNPLALNCLRTFPVIGTVSWGARTGRGADALADEYKYIPVRRLALFLEESLYRGTQWAVFEPNDEPLWAQIRLNLGAFMHTLYAQGAFQGRTPRDAYFVRCDKETTTQNDIDLGRVNIVVGFAPLKPAEFVVIQIQQIAGAILT